jgi:nicotinamide-nucleotide amidase
MRVVLISTGDEILLGEVVDTNAAHAAAFLADAGFAIIRHHTCSDLLADIVATLSLALAEADAVITCGGLGPTSDDRTFEAVAQVLSVPLETNPAVLTILHERFQALGAPLTPNQERQALLPRGAEALDNPKGTAPGLAARAGERLLFCLPGPPVEYRTMLEGPVLTRLLAERERRGERTVFVTRILKAFGKGEGWIAHAIGDLEREVPGLTLGYQAALPEIFVKLRARGESRAPVARILDDAERLVRERLGPIVFSADGRSLPETLLELLAALGLTLAAAESCTGGLLGKLLTDLPGSSRVFVLSAVTYANEMKERLLQVPRAILETSGAVSEACAKAMAEGVLRLSGADLGVAITGIAGPEGGTPEKPVGTVFIAVGDSRGIAVHQRSFGLRDRDWIRRLAAHNALDLLRRHVLKST